MKQHDSTNTYRQVLKGTALLSISSLIAKILSAVYRVPFQNLVGNVGFYTYQQVYPLYGIAVTISLTGMPVFISQMVAEADTLEEQRLVTRRLTALLWLVGLAIFAGLWLLAPLIAAGMGDRPLFTVIRGIAPVFLLAPIVAGARGYRQGRLELKPTAISQLGEQTVRVALVILVAVIASNQHWNVYLMGHWAMMASVVGSLTAVLLLIPTYVQLSKPIQNKSYSITRLWHRLWTGGGLLCLLAALMVLLQLIDAFTVKRGLVSSGLSQAHARSLKGVFDRAQPLAQLGLVIANSFAALLMPGLSKSRHAGDQKEYWHLYSMMIHYCLLISLFAAGGLIALMPQINQLLFKTRTGSIAIAVEMLAIIFAALINCYASVLQTIGRLKPLALSITAGLLVKLALNYWLVVHLKILGASVGSVVALAVMTYGCWQALPTRGHHGELSFISKLFIVTLLMMVIAALTANLVETIVGQSRLDEILVVAIAVLVGMIVAFALTLVSHLLTKEELKMIPGSSILLHWGKE